VTILPITETTFLFACVILWFAVAHRADPLFKDVLTLILAIAMGLQGIIGKKINLCGIPTIVLTSTLTNIVIRCDSLANRKFVLAIDTKRQIASFCLYLFGAVIASLLSFSNLSCIIVLPFAAVTAALTSQFRNPTVTDE
jgi:uncharacterized membrane protein YoaK (UPF0700 family)